MWDHATPSPLSHAWVHQLGGAVFLIDGSTQLVWDLQDPRKLAWGAAVRAFMQGKEGWIRDKGLGVAWS